jgi:alpha-L-fucosidase
MKYLIIFLLFIRTLAAQNITESANKDKDERMQWWREAKFGMFIHWGLYSILAGEWDGKEVTSFSSAEWIMDALKIPVSEYEKLLPQFNPVKFNAEEWVRSAKNAGMKYIVITSKHHEGFCLWPTGTTGWSVKSAPFKRDPLKELADACRKEGIKLCFYYSIMDWHHPLYENTRPWNDLVKGKPDMDKYTDYMKVHIKELITSYGPLGILWFDGEWEESWTEARAEDLIKYIKGLQPDIIINNRIGKARTGMAGLNAPGFKQLGDYGTPEQEIPSTGIPGLDWETCMTMNNTWGYSRFDNNWKSSNTLIYNLIDIASKGGNFLLNVGPEASGIFPDSSVKILDGIGRWMKINGESIYGTKASPFSKTGWGRCTQKEVNGSTRLYLHVLEYPAGNKLVLSGLMNRIKKAWMLSDKPGKLLQFSGSEGEFIIDLPGKAEPLYNVVVLEIEGKPEIINPPMIKTSSGAFVDSAEAAFNKQYDDVEIHYTLDGSLPEANSALLKDKLVITASGILSARYFRNGQPVSDTTNITFTKVTVAPAFQVNNPKPGILFKYYEGEWTVMPEFTKLTPMKEGATSEISLKEKGRKEFCGMEFTGYINIPEDDVYTFYLDSDDGSILYIDDVLVINNDGLHGLTELSSETALAKGYHKIKVSYFQATGGEGLNVSIRGKRIEKTVIPGGMLFH